MNRIFFFHASKTWKDRLQNHAEHDKNYTV